MSPEVLGHRLSSPALVVAFVLLGAAVALAAITGAPWWLIAVGVIGPDLSFLAAVGQQPLRPGLMPPRAVRPYNAVHHAAGPVALFAVALLAASAPLTTLALAWGSHLAWDRGVGYGLLAPDGSMRPARERRHTAFVTRRPA